MPVDASGGLLFPVQFGLPADVLPPPTTATSCLGHPRTGAKHGLHSQVLAASFLPKYLAIAPAFHTTASLAYPTAAGDTGDPLSANPEDS